jgi:hypothetical protein
MSEPREIRLSTCTLEQFIAVRSRIEQLPRVPTFEQAAQEVTEALYSAFRPSLVLVRMFITVPYRRLPADIQRAVSDASQAQGVRDLLKPDTLVLALAGTAGRGLAWNDRRGSRGHRGIPLISSHFVSSTPMVARLLQQMGVGLDWIDTSDLSLFDHSVASRLFYVPDAAMTVDAQRRKVIPDQDFVRAHGVKTVFGVGGSFIMSQSALMTLIGFCSEPVPKGIASWFSTITTQLMARTLSTVQAGALFRP